MVRQRGIFLILRTPITARPGLVTAPTRAWRREEVTGPAPLPSDLVSLLAAFLFLTTWTRGGLLGCVAAAGNPGRATAPVASSLGS